MLPPLRSLNVYILFMVVVALSQQSHPVTFMVLVALSQQSHPLTPVSYSV